MHKIIIDTDPGIDDAQAIAFAIAHPEIKLVGLTTVFGNAQVALTTRNALKILEVFGQPDIPVAAGASQPLEQPRFPEPDFVHGSDGIGNLNLSPPNAIASSISAAEFIVQQASLAPGEITVVAIGPLTNIALALELDPQLPSKLKQLVVMGGTVDEPGNVTPLAEANFINDPHAADRVLAHDWPCVIIGLDVTLKTLLTDGHLGQLRDHGSAMGKFLWDSSRFYIDFYTSRFTRTELAPTVPCCAMHDASAVVYVVIPDAFELVGGPARVIEEGVATGQLAIDRKAEPYVLPHWDNRPTTYAAIGVKSDQVVDVFLQTLLNY
ncbi:MAG: inosine-uridine nucleoside N-ribohydrolase [Cryomorphaceae bacterium]|jgi:inosine-uridine nucleoside N-ribohydrolase